MKQVRKPLVFLGDTRDVLTSLPEPARHKLGRALAIVQMGNLPADVKFLKGFPVAVQEIRVAHDSEAYRAVYTLALGSRVYLLHVFHKKSKKGIGIPQRDLDLIRQRLSFAVRMEDEQDG